MKNTFILGLLAVIAIATGCDSNRVANAPYKLEPPSLEPQPVEVITRFAAPQGGPELGTLAPEISGVDIDGIEFKLSDYRGKVVMLDFYGDW